MTPNPPHMWSLIEQDLVQWDKATAQHYLDNLIEIIESPELLEKVSGYTRVMFGLYIPQQRYVEGGSHDGRGIEEGLYLAHRVPPCHC